MLDEKEVEKDGNFPLRAGGEFFPLVAISCRECGWVFFMPLAEANKRDISVEYRHVGGNDG